jgi:N4-gp56 family major capsid protein
MALPTVASVISSGLGAYPTVFFERKALDELYSNLFMYQACDQRPMPNNSGVAMQIYDHSKMAANTVAVTEGTPFSGQAMTQNVRTLNLANYADFISYSNKVLLTAFVDTVEHGSRLLAYRGALSVDTVISTAVDNEANSDATNVGIDVNHGSFMTALLARKACWQLRSKDVKPKANGNYFGIIHSLAAFDLVNESTASGFTDLQKYSDTLAAKNPALVGIQGQRVGLVGGVEFYESNAVPTETAWQSSANIAYHTYVFGHEAFVASSLGKTQLGQKNFSVQQTRYPGGNSIDVAGLIGASSWYNFFFGVVKTTGSINKFRRIRSESSIG